MGCFDKAIRILAFFIFLPFLALSIQGSYSYWREGDPDIAIALAVMASLVFMLMLFVILTYKPKKPTSQTKSQSMNRSKSSSFSPRKTLTTPESVTKYVLDNYDKITEQEIGTAEREVKKHDYFSPELGLLYAMRVLKNVGTFSTFRTMESRWENANYGPDGHGLGSSSESPNHKKVYQLLSSMFIASCEEIYHDKKAKAMERKTSKTKINALIKLGDDIDGLFISNFDEWDQFKLRCSQELDEMIDNLEEPN